MPRGSSDPVAVDPRVIRTHDDVLETAIQVLIDEGWEAVTHQHIAQVAGYSKATLYKHWPSRTDLIVDAFSRFADMSHHTPSGDLRSDLLREVTTFRTGMVQHRLDRVLAVLSDLTHSVPELVPVRDKLVSDGEQVVRELLAPVCTELEVEAATLMLCGAVLHSALMHGQPPSDEVIEAAVDVTLRGLGRPPKPGSSGPGRGRR